MAEQIVLTNPIVIPSKTTTEWHVAQLNLDPDNARFTLIVKSNQFDLIVAFRQGIPAVDLMKVFNKANGQTKSLEKRAMEWLQTQPEGAPLIGSITGTPD